MKLVHIKPWLLAALAVACGGDRDAGAGRAAGDATPVDLREPGYTRGSPAARLVVIEFSDFGCAYCRAFTLSTYPALHRDFVETGRVRWRYVPFVIGRFTNADRATMAAECAAEQSEASFWTMKQLLYEHQADWTRASRADDALTRLAADAGLETAAFAACMAADAARARIDRSNRMAALGRVSGTPTFFIDGRRVLGALPEERFREILRAALGDAAP